MQDSFEYKIPMKFQIIIRQSILCLNNSKYGSKG